MENLSGLQLGPYQVLEPLGEGGMAVIYKAYQPNMERYVALKVLARKLATSPEFIGRFKQEAKVLANLQHPCIVPVFDYGAAEGYTYIVMPYIESGTLTERMRGGQPFPPGQIMQAITQVGDALDYAHSFGLVHRDIKPSNILIDKRGNCLLTDFGIAKLYESGTGFTSTGTMVGTPAYMSPEQGRGSTLDHRSDIYSLGIVLYEMTTGRVPYMAETPVAIVFKHIQDPLPLPRQINANLPEALERVVLKALAKSPDDRYQTARDFVKAIQIAGQELGVLPEPLSTLGTAAGTTPGTAELFRAKSTGNAKVEATPTPEVRTVIGPVDAAASPVAPPPASRPPTAPVVSPSPPPSQAPPPRPIPVLQPRPPVVAKSPGKKIPVWVWAGGAVLFFGAVVCVFSAISIAAKPAPTATATVEPTVAPTSRPPTLTRTSPPRATPTPAASPTPVATATPTPVGWLQTGAETVEIWAGVPITAADFAALFLPGTADLPFEAFLQAGSQLRLDAVTPARVSLSLLPASDVFVQTGAFPEGGGLLFDELPLVMNAQGCWAAHYAPDNAPPLTLSCYQGACTYQLNDEATQPIEAGAQVTFKNLADLVAAKRAIPNTEKRAYITALSGDERGAQTLVTCGLVAAPTLTPTPRATTVRGTPRPTNIPSPTTNSNNLPTATPVPPTSVPPTSIPPTSIPPTSIPPTSIPPTSLPPTNTPVPPTDPPQLPPTNTPVPPTDPPQLPPTNTPPP